MFTLTCECCSAKLKVLQPSAIGQMLACPKCGEMVRITPPAGWVPPEGWPPNISTTSSSSAINSSVNSASEFGDVDLLLKHGQITVPSAGKSPASSAQQRTLAKPPDKPGISRQVPAGSKTESRPALGTPAMRPNAPNETNDNRTSAKQPRAIAHTENTFQLSPPGDQSAVSADTAIAVDVSARNSAGLPPPGWSQQSNSKHRVWLIAIAGLLGVTAVVIAIVSQIPKSDKEISAQNKPEQPSEVAEDNASSVIAEAGSTPTTDTAGEGAKSNNAQVGSDATQPAPPENSAEAQTVNDAANRPPILDSSSAKANTDATSNNSDAQQPPMTSLSEAEKESSPITGEALSDNDDKPVSPLAGGDNQSPLGAKTTDIAPSTEMTKSNDAKSLREGLGELTNLLGQAGLTLTELSDIADNERSDRLAGLPRFYISKPRIAPASGDFWAMPIREAQYDNVPLVMFLQDAARLAGKPISLNAVAIQRHGVAPSVSVHVNAQDTTLAGMIDEVLSTLDLERLDIGEVILIQPKGAGAVSNFRTPLPKINASTPEKLAVFAANLPQLIDPASWTADPQLTKLSIDGDQLVIDHNVLIRDQIVEFIQKLDAASLLTGNPTDPDALDRLRSRWSRAAESLSKPVSLKPAFDQPLETMLAEIYRDTGILVCIDWQALTPQGWSPAAEVPGDFQTANVDELLKELSRSLGATVVSINASTFMLTSFEAASQTSEIEIYPLTPVVSGPIQAPQIMEILNQTLGPQLRDVLTLRVLLEPECNSLIVIAPQSIQRQVEAILERIKSGKGR